MTGYPPEDLLLKEHFLADAREAVDRIAVDAQGIVAIVGFPERALDVYNAAAVCADGAVRGTYRKMHLPNYGVFDEVRYFQSGHGPALIEVDGVTVGLTICEDIWQPGVPMSQEALAGATVVVNISASPYVAGKGIVRERMIAQRARDHLCAVAFCGLVGGQDELIFDGHSFVVDHDGDVIARSPQFKEDLLVAEIDPQAALSARLRDTRRRPAARALRERGPEPRLVQRARRSIGGAGRPQGRGHAAAGPLRGDLRGARPRHARLRGEERLPPRRDRPERRDRLHARRAPGRRRPGARPRHHRHHALPVLVVGNAGGRPPPRAQPRRARSSRSPSSR